MINYISSNAVRYDFHAKNLLEAGGQPCDGQHPDVLVDKTSRIDVYTVLDDPGHPRYTQGEKSEPWASALHFAIFYCLTDGLNQVLHANFAVVGHLFKDHGLKYDRKESRARYAGTGKTHGTPDSSPPNVGVIELESYMLRTDLLCNCHDQMGAVTVVTNLVSGDTSYAHYFDKFGYIPEADLIGGYRTNNPVKDMESEGNQIFDQRDIVGTDDLIFDLDNDGDLDRSVFSNHAFVLTYSIVHDACVGPYHHTQGHSVTAYLAAARDRTTAPECSIYGIDPATGQPGVVDAYAAAGSEAILTMLLRLE